MKYLFKRKNGKYYYARRVPTEVSDFDPRERVRIALKTSSESMAIERANVINKEIEAYWQSLLASGNSYTDEHFKKTKEKARIMGFQYMSISDVSKLPLTDLTHRIETVSKHRTEKSFVHALLGTNKSTSLFISGALECYLSCSRDRTLNKSDNQKTWKRN